MISLCTFGLRVMPALLAAALVVDPSSAQDNCLKTNRLDQHCAAQLIKKADDNLNAAYAPAIASMREADLGQVDVLQGYESALRAAQRAWISFRAAECELAKFSERGGSGAGIAGAACYIEMTEERMKFLKWAAESYARAGLHKSTP